MSQRAASTDSASMPRLQALWWREVRRTATIEDREIVRRIPTNLGHPTEITTTWPTRFVYGTPLPNPDGYIGCGEAVAGTPRV